MTASAPASYPFRNPFPHQGTLRLAGQRLDGSVPMVAGDFRTIFRLPIKKLEGFLTAFLSRFQPEWSSDGGAAFVRGSHGSGKTHALFAAWNSFQSHKRVFPIYVVLQENDFLSLYRQFIGRLSLPLLVELSRGLLANMTVEQLSASVVENHASVDELSESGASENPAAKAQSSPEEKLLRQDLKANPLGVKKLFSKYVVEEGATKRRQRGTLAELTQGNSDLNRAVQCLQGDQFASDVADWFCLKPVTPDRLQVMGIAGPISTPLQAAAAMELLAALFTLANRPLVLFIDQFEKLTQGEAASTNTGLIRSLMETFESRNAALVLSGTQEGWTSLPEDARQRIGLGVIDCELLTLEESLDLVRIYVIPVQEEFRPGAGSLYPFTEEAVREIVRLSSGNPRKLLQYCHLVFRKAQASQSIIDLHLVSSTAKSELANQFFDKASVMQETRQILSRQPYRLVEKFAIGDLRFDFALLSGKRASVLVNVTDAIYGDDEAANAIITADTVGKLRATGELATFVLVATGYVSPEVTDRLRRAVNELIVFALEDFAPRLDKVLEWARLHPPSSPDREELTASERAALREALSQIGTQRASETKVLQSRQEQVSETHAQRRYAERRDTARIEWSERRSQIEGRIAVVRKERADQERARCDKERKSANLKRWALDAGLVVFAVFGSFLLQNARPQPREFVIALSALVPFALVLWDLTLLFIRGEWVWRSLSDTELAQWARRRDPLEIATWIRTPSMRFLFNARRIRMRSMPEEQLRDLIRSEPLATLRLAYGRFLMDERLSAEMRSHVATCAPEAAVLGEDAKVAEELKSQSPPFDLLAALYGPPGPPSPRLAYELCQAAGAGGPGWYSPAALAFDKGLDRTDLSLLANFSERQIRAALRELSPFDAPGLGTFDFLSKIAEVDQAYLFCSQLLLYFERDLLGKAE